MLFKTQKKRISVIVSIIALILVSGYVLYSVKKEKFLKHHVPTIVKEKTNGQGRRI